MDGISLAASLVTLLEVANATRDLGERFAKAAGEIAVLAKNITRLSGSLYLLAEALSDPIVQQHYRKNEIRILDVHLNDARSALHRLSAILQKYRSAGPVSRRMMWVKDSSKVTKLQQSLKNTCDALLFDLNSIHFRTAARTHVTLNDVKVSAAAIVAGSSRLPSGSPIQQPFAMAARVKDPGSLSLFNSTLPPRGTRFENTHAHPISPISELRRRYEWTSSPRPRARTLESALRALMFLLHRQPKGVRLLSSNCAGLLAASRILNRFMDLTTPGIQYATSELCEMAMRDRWTLQDLQNYRKSSKDFRDAFGSRSTPLAGIESCWLDEPDAKPWDVDFLQKLLALNPSWRLATRLDDGPTQYNPSYTSDSGTPNHLPMVAFAFMARVFQMTLLIPEFPMARPMELTKLSFEERTLTQCFASNLELRIRTNHVATVRQALVQLQHNHGISFLHIAVARGDLVALENAMTFLFSDQSGIQSPMSILNYQDTSLMTPLMRAARKNDVNLIEILLRRQPDVNTRDSSGNTVLHLLLDHQLPNRRAFEVLKKAGADLRVRNNFGETCLHFAAWHEDLCCELIPDMQVMINTGDNYGHTPLMIASYCGHALAVAQLCHDGALVHMSDYLQRTAMHWAVMGLSSDVIPVLRRYGARFDLVALPGQQPLLNQAIMRANELGVNDCTVLVKSLVECGASLDSVGPDGQTPLLLAVSSHRPRLSLFKYLVEAGADISRNSASGTSLLYYMCFDRGFTDTSALRDMVSALDFLLDNDINLDPTMLGAHGQTALDHLLVNYYGYNDEIVALKECVLRKLQLMAEKIGEACKTRFITSLWRVIGTHLRTVCDSDRRNIHTAATRRMLGIMDEVCGRKGLRQRHWSLTGKRMVLSFPWKENCLEYGWIRFIVNDFEIRGSDRRLLSSIGCFHGRWEADGD